MTKGTKVSIAELLAAYLESHDLKGMPVYRRVFSVIRYAIVHHHIKGGTKLPSSRDLADDLSISRNTVVIAYENLQAEGFVECRGGSGTFVIDSLPDTVQKSLSRSIERDPDNQYRQLSQRGQKLTAVSAEEHYEIQEFDDGANDFSLFPHKLWQRLQNKHWQSPTHHVLDYSRDGGYRPLREALAEYLTVTRSARLSPDQIIITAGTQQSLDLCALMLANVNDVIWMENPCYWGARLVFEANDLKLHPVAVDNEGIFPQEHDLRVPPNLIYVTPSHQYPLDVVMSLSRRRFLIEVAARYGAWIIEDDYDSEFRYGGYPLASLQGLDHYNRVIYLGTFSKVLYPGIRIGYIVVPPDLVDAFKVGLSNFHRPGQMAIQAALADFISNGHFASHIRTMRHRYRESRAVLQRTLKSQLRLPAYISSPNDSGTGLHMVIHLPDNADDKAFAIEAKKRGIDVKALSSYYLSAPIKNGLVVGYGYTPQTRIEPLAIMLADVVNQGLERLGSFEVNQTFLN